MADKNYKVKIIHKKNKKSNKSNKSKKKNNNKK